MVKKKAWKLIASKTPAAFIVIAFAISGFLGALYLLNKNISYQPAVTQKFLLIDSTKNNIIYDTLEIQSKYFSNPVKSDSINTNELKQGQKAIDISSTFYHNNSQYLIWMILISLMTGYSLSFLPLIIKTIIDDHQVFELKYFEYIVIIAPPILLIYFLGKYSGNSPYLLSAQELINMTGVLMKNTSSISLIIVINICIGALTLIGQILIGNSIPKLSGKNTKDNTRDVAEILRIFSTYRDNLKFYLTFLAGMISFTVITTSFLRKTINTELDAGNFNLFPVEFVFVYGMIFTLFLAMFYLPIYYQLRMKGVELKEKFSSTPDEENKSKANVEGFELKETGISNFQVALSILSPFISTIIGEIVNF